MTRQKISSADENAALVSVGSCEPPQHREPEIKLEADDDSVSFTKLVEIKNEFDDSGTDFGDVWMGNRVPNLYEVKTDIFYSFQQPKLFVKSCNRMFRKLFLFQSGQIVEKISEKDIKESTESISQIFRNFASFQRYDARYFMCYISGRVVNFEDMHT